MWLLWLLACDPIPATPVDLPVPIATPVAQVAPEPAPAEPPAGPVVCGLDPYVAGPHDETWLALGTRLGLDAPRAFVSVVNTVRTTGDLPDCYLTKRQAEARGWDRGERVWDDLPGMAIGGDTFGNRERRLPRIDRPRRYVEADLDQQAGRRGARRLVFEDDRTGADARIWVTVDHYDSFVPVEAP